MEGEAIGDRPCFEYRWNLRVCGSRPSPSAITLNITETKWRVN
jgi:hypothetical protein